MSFQNRSKRGERENTIFNLVVIQSRYSNNSWHSHRNCNLDTRLNSSAYSAYLPQKKPHCPDPPIIQEYEASLDQIESRPVHTYLIQVQLRLHPIQLHVPSCPPLTASPSDKLKRSRAPKTPLPPSSYNDLLLSRRRR